MELFSVDSDRCKRDGICVAECPLKIIELKDKKSVPTPVKDAEKLCINCGHCVSVCPHSAISLGKMKTEDCPPVRGEWALSPEHAEHFLRSRRSIRCYKKQDVERDVLESLIKIARYAPTGTNSQKVKWLAFRTRDDVLRLSGMTIEWMRHLIQENHPMTRNYRLAEIVKAWENGIDIVCRGAPALVIAYAPEDYGLARVDCTIALTFLDLAAPSLGLGTCWAGFFMIAAANWPPLAEYLSLPEGHSPFGAMMVGYPKYRYYRLPLRNEPDITWRG